MNNKISSTLKNKYNSLIDYLKQLGNVVVAFSGGVDSSFLIYAAKEALGSEVLAITVTTDYIPKWEVEEAVAFTKKYNINHQIKSVAFKESLRENPENHCYLCKHHIFNSLLEIARSKQIPYLLEGTNSDDLGDYRPGMKALKELEIYSPLLENNFSKNDIRILSKHFGLETWDKPAYACLLSRIPYHTKVTKEKLERIEKSEKYLMDLGFRAVRVRDHDAVARIELSPEFFSEISKSAMAKQISEKLKSFGYQYVSLDLQGYRMGSLNETILKKDE